MKEFSIAERFRLEVHWDRVEYLNEDTARLQGCYLSGPVLAQVQAIEPKDSIRLDFSGQYVVFIKNYYIARLAWDGAVIKESKILLDNVTYKSVNIGKIPTLQDRDYIVIDTKDHEDEKHQVNLNYKSYLVKEDGVLYNFGV